MLAFLHVCHSGGGCVPLWTSRRPHWLTLVYIVKEIMEMAHYTKRLYLSFFALAVTVMVAGCAEKPAVVPLEPPASTSATYAGEIQPLFDNRCIACHGCIGSPCNVKLSSFRGLERGGFGKNPYSLHFDAVPRTGMDVHATIEGWRKVGFYPVVSRGGSAT